MFSGQRVSFAETAETLGVMLDLQHASAGTIKVANKPNRMDGLEPTVQHIISSGRVVTKDLPSFFGRASFVESQFMGREGRLALSELRAMERSKSQWVELSAAQMDALKNLLTGYHKAVPRSLKVDGRA